MRRQPWPCPLCLCEDTLNDHPSHLQSGQSLPPIPELSDASRERFPLQDRGSTIHAFSWSIFDTFLDETTSRPIGVLGAGGGI